MPPKTRKQKEINRDQVALFIRQRNVIKTKVENIKKFLDTFNLETNSINALKIAKLDLERYSQEHDKINRNLLDLVEDSEVEQLSKQINEFENYVRVVQSKLHDFLDQCNDDSSSSKSFGSQDKTIKPFIGLTSSTMIQNADDYDNSTRSNAHFNVPQNEVKNFDNLDAASSFKNQNAISEPNAFVHNPIMSHEQNTYSNSINCPPSQNTQNAPIPIVSSQQQIPHPSFQQHVSQHNASCHAQFNYSSANVRSDQTHYNPPNANFRSSQSAQPTFSRINQPALNFKPITITAPNLELPTFDGNPLNWLTFKQMFIAIIHAREDFDDIVKFSYLLKHLTGKALLGLGHVTLTSQGYNIAWQQLLNEFDNNCILVDTNIDHLLSLPYCNREQSSDLRNLLNNCQLHVSTLSALNFNIDALSERMLINIVKKRLDPASRKLWEEQQIMNQYSTWNQMISFIQRRCQIMESLESCKKPFTPRPIENLKFAQKNSHSKSFSSTNSSSTEKSSQSVSKNKEHSVNIKPNTSANKSKLKCSFCNKNNHKIYNCLKFLKLSAQDRLTRINELRSCVNCLQFGHMVTDCASTFVCKYCENKHNSLLHVNKSNSNQNHLSTVQANKIENNSSGMSVTTSESSLQNYYSVKSEVKPVQKPSNAVLLSTAIILIANNKNVFSQCRVLLDSGSQSNFISNTLAKKLQLPKIHTNHSISLLNENKTEITHKIHTKIKSRINKFHHDVEFQIVPVITENFPSNNINVSKWSIPNNIVLADPSFNIPSSIDVLLGAEIYYKILKSKRFHINPNQPVLFETQLGWIFGGAYKESITHNFLTISSDFVESETKDDLNSLLPKFWDIVETSNKKYLSDEEQLCEKHFTATHTRDKYGRFVVDLPFNQNLSLLGDSKFIAEKRFSYLEHKLKSNESLSLEYKKFIDEYRNLNHMKLVDESLDDPAQQTFYLPHHCVLKPSSSTTKLRVVFDASAKSSSGTSLNDVLMVGPVVQDDLFSIVLRFRKHNIAFTADIKKMYRQIKVRESHTPYQRILWRDNLNEPIQTYELTTVTYGTASAPYLATKALNQLGIENASNFESASRVVLEDFYVDDLLSGAETIESALILHKDIITLLAKGGFELHKWSSNCDALLKNIPRENRELLQTNEYSNNESIKTLGLFWHPSKDIFTFNIEKLSHDAKFTKRSILSNIAKLYDPLGLISPSIVIAKLLMQNLWKCKIDWDDPISVEDRKTWLAFRENLSCLEDIELNRHVMLCDYDRIELHGFCDASTVAYGACLYVKSIKNDQVFVMLLCSKSRVAPLKTITVAKLELCAAVLLAQLTSKVRIALKVNFHHIQLWTDSEIVLAWIKTPPFKLNTFVANRVAEIQMLSQELNWCHVSSLDNPADLVSRGVMPQDLVGNCMWWYGPPFLNARNCSYSNSNEMPANLEIIELKSQFKNSNKLNVNAATIKNEEFYLINKFGSFSKLLRVTALIFRFYFNCRKDSKLNKKLGHLSCEEISFATSKIVKIIQQSHFKSEIKTLSQKQDLPNSSSIKNLAPFLDEHNILRVGGRLRNTEYEFNVKHPILLPHNHHFTNLLFREYHIKNIHAGPNLLVSLVRQTYWPIKAKQTAKKNSTHVCHLF